MPIQPVRIDADLLARVQDIVREAGRIILDGRAKSADAKNIQRKGRIDLVTDTDLAVEAFLKERLASVLPGAAFLAEESAQSYDLSGLTWVIDPVDGTTNFAHDLPFVATSVGLWQDGRIVLGVVNAPVLGECFSTLRGGGAFLNDAPMRVSTTADLESALIATGFPYTVRENLDNLVGNLRTVLHATQGVRRAGAAALDLAYTAAGRLDAFYEIELKPWDTAAGWLLVEEAGGRVTTFEPATPYSLGYRTILASNGRIHDAVAGLLEMP